MLAHLAALRALCEVTPAGVSFAGHTLGLSCAVRARLGLPCPTCGITRGVVLAVHGRIGEAWNLSPGGVAAVIGMTLLAVALVVLGWRQQSGLGSSASRWIRRGAVAWAGATVVVWMGGWAAALWTALGSR